MARNQFKLIIKDTHQISTVYEHFKVPILDDLLRWQWTQAVSALDKYIHDIVKIGLIKTFNKEITPTNSFNNFSVPVSILEDSLLVSNAFEQFVIKKLSFVSFQTAEKINEGLSLIWTEPHKWQKIADNLGLEKKYLTNKLNLIAQRRNQIVHQGDYPSFNLEKEKLNTKETLDVINFIDQIVDVIHCELEKEFIKRKM
ncbi:HEPN domain-containing protein [Bacillus licheniformis]|nr:MULTISPECIES: HEPN domain-containing protein [Bacillus]MCY7953212.1 HEPN domain-containing protein [Bacillus licheniformis]MCY8157537.1 HEPN domain-containing protein [Bacillus licheniformis]MCY8743306.1 HEPN domain-containing protein [Bacillus licheniformis]MCY9219302.1 HEPN domain-containing protein [Bacillus licheniformis]MCY9284976.1 HEPN domain-containing protein [Bacillus licheniformis]